MSRAFVKEDDGDVKPRISFGLPSRRDRSFNSAAALALLEGARDGYTAEAEEATGYKWGDPHLHPHVQKLMDKELERPDDEQDRRFIQMARRFLRYR
ncbi:MAG TPA: hypothetical protein VM100_09765 [Longimicrobiales bacterium]|nr:hypothetical protein [Longimicrobiales bacterium]